MKTEHSGHPGQGSTGVRFSEEVLLFLVGRVDLRSLGSSAVLLLRLSNTEKGDEGALVASMSRMMSAYSRAAEVEVGDSTHVRVALRSCAKEAGEPEVEMQSSRASSALRHPWVGKDVVGAAVATLAASAVVTACDSPCVRPAKKWSKDGCGRLIGAVYAGAYMAW